MWYILQWFTRLQNGPLVTYLPEGRHIVRKQETEKQKTRVENKKKKGDLVMKTKNVFRKTVATLAAFGLTLVFLTQSAMAQGFGKGADDNDTKSGKKTQAVTTVTAASYAAELEARKKASAIFNIVDEPDPTLYLQQWMVDRRNFVVTPAKSASEKQEPANSKQVSDSTLNAISTLLIIEKESPLKLESWMTDAKCFPCESKRSSENYYSMK